MNINDFMANYKPPQALNDAAYAGVPGWLGAGNEVPMSLEQAQAQLASMQKYDPNASLTTLAGTEYSNDTGTGVRPDQYTLNMDWSKIPKLQNQGAISSQQHALETGDYKNYGLQNFDPNSTTFNSQSKYGGHSWLSDPTKVWQDPNYGSITPASNYHSLYTGTKRDATNAMIGKAILAISLGGMGAGFAGALGLSGIPGSLASGAFKTGVGSLISGQSPTAGSVGNIASSALMKNFNPVSFLGGG